MTNKNKDDTTAKIPKIILTIDLEVGPDPQAQLLLNTRDSARAASWAISRIEVATVLIARASRTGWHISDFLTYDANPDSEHNDCDEQTLLYEVARLISTTQKEYDPRNSLPRILTYNGNAFDLPILRQRAMLHDLFEERQLFDYSGVEPFDMMLELAPAWRTKSPTLKQAAAGLRIPATHMVRRGPPGPYSAQGAKCQVDVCATFLLHAYHMAAVTGDRGVVNDCWAALARFIGNRRNTPGHLAQFAQHEMAVKR